MVRFEKLKKRKKMKPPDNSELTNAVQILQKLRDYILNANLDSAYDLYLLDGAANTVEHFTETENDNKKTPKTKNKTKETTTNTDTDYGPSAYNPIDR